MKTCTKCKIEKELIEFSKCKLTKDGLQCSCKSCIKEYNQNNIDNRKAYDKEYYRKNSNKIKEYKKAYKKNRIAIDPLYKLTCNLRSRTRNAFRVNFWQKNNTTAEILGASYEICAQNIEKQFIEGMTWDNYGLWHIDHIIPLASATTEEELIILCHYTNLQPLSAEDNLKKGCKILI